MSMLGFEYSDHSEYEAHRVTAAQLREPLCSHGLGADSTITNKSRPGQGWGTRRRVEHLPAEAWLVRGTVCGQGLRMVDRTTSHSQGVKEA